jgi:hypothetical protein
MSLHLLSMGNLTLNLLIDFALDQQIIHVHLRRFHAVILLPTLEETALAHLCHMVLLAQVLVTKCKPLQVMLQCIFDVAKVLIFAPCVME